MKIGGYLDLYAPIVTRLSRPPQIYHYRRGYEEITLLQVLKAKNVPQNEVFSELSK
jgi:hypothetical protein